MDGWIRQMRGRFLNAGQENSEEPSSFKDRRIPLQKTQSFKGERKRAQNWLRRQFSRQMSGDLDSNSQMERATAVAAAAYAIKSMEGSPIPDQRKTSSGPSQSFLSRLKSKKEDTSNSTPEPKKDSAGPEPSLSRLKSKKEDTQSPGRVSKRFSGENATSSISPDGEVPIAATKDEKAPEKATSFKKSTTFADEPLIIPDTTRTKRTPSKVTDRGPSMKKTPTFADELLERTSSKKTEGASPKIDLSPSRPGRTPSKPDIPSPIKPATPPAETIRQSSTGPQKNGTIADAWEKVKMAKIKKRYDKLNETIVSWENRKKNKARRKLNKTESELEKRRLKALQKFGRDVESIEQIAAGAKAQALEKRRREEFKAKVNANIIRTTGKVPATCLCF